MESNTEKLVQAKEETCVKEFGDYAEAKVYFDGGHYIAIPYVPNPFAGKKKYKKKEQPVVVVEGDDFDFDIEEIEEEFGLESVKDDYVVDEETREQIKQENEKARKSNPKPKTLKEYFEEFYTQSLELDKKKRENYIIKKMQEYFSSYEEAKEYVVKNMQRKTNNLIAKKTRFYRKAYLNEFNYFCTFTYDSAKHTEESFKKQLSKTLRNLASRKGWKYIGVWERGEKTERLHFHAIVYVPEGQMQGSLFKTSTYSFRNRVRKEVCQNTYFNTRFGMSDFEEIETRSDLVSEMGYLLKYIEKTGEKLVYSRGLPQFFISDIMDEDILCRTGREERKFVLSDKFNCWDEGCLIGPVSSETIKQMRKVN